MGSFCTSMRACYSEKEKSICIGTSMRACYSEKEKSICIKHQEHTGHSSVSNLKFWLNRGSTLSMINDCYLFCCDIYITME